MELAHARHGRLKWEEVVEPARKLAQDGVPVGSHLAQDIEGLLTTYYPKYGEYVSKGLKEYLTRNGHLKTYLREGELLKNPALAKTLQRVAEQAADALYKGENARSLVKEVQDAGGILGVEDMEGYKATLRSPVHADVSGYTVGKWLPLPSLLWFGLLSNSPHFDAKLGSLLRVLVELWSLALLDSLLDTEHHWLLLLKPCLCTE